MSQIPLAQTSFNAMPSRCEARVSDYFALLKPKVMSLVVFSGFAGLWVAPGAEAMHPFLIAVAMLCLAINAGAAGAINMWYDRDIDSIMERTRQRPIPTGRVTPDDALAMGVVLSIVSVMIMGLALNWTAAGLLAAANAFYVFIYTLWLKRRTPQNIVIGGAAGAFPPLIGWAAVTGEIGWIPFILFAVIFLWTPPHFWALSLFANEDYKRARIPMMSVVAGAASTKRQMLIYALVLLPVSLGPWAMGHSSEAFGACAFALGALFVASTLQVWRHEDLKYARRLFGYSIFYLFAYFTALMIF